MKQISKKNIDYILDNTNIVDLVGEYVKLEHRGRNYIGLCPFHNEKTPSFSVSPDKKIAHCFGCGKGGNIFQFLSQIENITYNQAIVKLGSKLGLELESEEKNKYETYDLSKELDVMYYAHSLIADYYNYILLNTEEAREALEYLLNRGLTIETIKYFNLGYAPKNNNVALNFFKNNNLSLDIMVDCGLLLKSSINEEYFDMFKDRVMYPIKNNKNQVVAFSGRTMSKEEGIAKYYNTHATKIFEKRTVLYNLSDARQYIIKQNEIILCEGYMDVIQAHQAGVKNTVALMGTNLDDDKLSELLTMADKVTLALDNDKAGEKAQLEIGNKWLKRTDNVFKLFFTGAKDIDEFLSNKIKNIKDFDVLNYIENNKLHFLNFKINIFSNLSKNSIEKKLTYKKEILEDIACITDESLKYILLNYLAEKFEIDISILKSEINTVKIFKKNKNNNSYNLRFETPQQFFNNIKYDRVLCRLFKYYFNDKNLFLKTFDIFSKCKLTDEFLMLRKLLTIYYNNNYKFEIHKFIGNIDNEELIRLVTFIDETDFLLESDISIDIVNDYIAYLLKKEENNINILKNKLTVAIREKDVDLQRELLNELKNFKK